METAFKHKLQMTQVKKAYLIPLVLIVTFNMALAGVIMWVLNSCQSYFTPNSPVYTLVRIFN